MMRGTLAVILLIALAMSAGAYDVLYSNDTAATHEPGLFGIGASFIYFAADQWYDGDGEIQDGIVTDDVLDDNSTLTRKWFPVDIYYGVLDGFEIGATPIFMLEKMTDPDSVVDETGTGIGDTWIWAKYNIAPDPLMTARVGVKIATGNHEILDGEHELALGTGQMDVDGAFMFGVPLPDGFFDGSIGYRYRMAESAEDGADEFKFGNEIHFFVGYTHFLNDALSLRVGADGYFGSDPTEDGEPIAGANPDEFKTGPSAVYINPSFDYIMDGGLSLGIDVHYPLMGANVDAAWAVGLSVGWGG